MVTVITTILLVLGVRKVKIKFSQLPKYRYLKIFLFYYESCLSEILTFIPEQKRILCTMVS